MLASDVQACFEATTRLLLLSQTTAEFGEPSLEPRLATASRIGTAWYESQETIALALMAPTLTKGEKRHNAQLAALQLVKDCPAEGIAQY